jgi:transporter family-2 protein
MSTYLASAMLVAAGVALVVQNAVMTRIAAASGILVALALNSAVGLAALLIALVGRTGFGGFLDLAGAFRLRALLPGLLGSFFVFASVQGYRTLGAAPTIAVLVASQLAAGLACDAIATRFHNVAMRPLAGAALLVVGAILVAGGPRP